MQITDILHQTWNVDCIGCAVGAGKMIPPGGMIAENSNSYVHQEPEIPLAGFLIIAPRRHIGSIIDLTPIEYADFSALLLQARNALRLLTEIRSFTLVQEERSGHFHLWLFPWYDWMVEKYGNESLTHIRPIMEFAKTAWNTPQQRQLILDGVALLKNALD